MNDLLAARALEAISYLPAGTYFANGEWTEAGLVELAALTKPNDIMKDLSWKPVEESKHEL